MSGKGITAVRSKEYAEERAARQQARKATEREFMHVREPKPAWTDTYNNLTT
eukprot:CAMPEP_0118931830 /NCGR_PEP_ID=MMETSP1169-20130426/8035_1 /TAXON_ID=36882 /ORGANISM="Pyramimonas obovata, Strain CCMP722" /LENGTH=51 /DNA_ID=CAMNT_0006874381 /DNA_START=287 /DNA_END=442 /DNA_ORIENTATION=+